MTVIKKVSFTLAALFGVFYFENAVEAQDVNRRTVKTFSEYKAEEQARMYEWYGHGQPPLIAPAAGPVFSTQSDRPQRRHWWEDDIGIKRYVPPLGSERRPFVIQVEPAPPSGPPMLLAPAR